VLLHKYDIYILARTSCIVNPIIKTVSVFERFSGLPISLHIINMGPVVQSVCLQTAGATNMVRTPTEWIVNALAFEVRL
jgi:hypothetical protein